jgi:hypothetical protein
MRAGAKLLVSRDPGILPPGGGTFDFAQSPWINDPGDIAFGAHVAGEECIDFGIPQTVQIHCAESVYLKGAATGLIESIAHQGSPAPGGGTYRFAFGPVMNNQREIVFIGDLTPPPGFGSALAVFLNSHGTTSAIARPGDPMPGGENFVSASFFKLPQRALGIREPLPPRALLALFTLCCADSCVPAVLPRTAKTFTFASARTFAT